MSNIVGMEHRLEILFKKGEFNYLVITRRDPKVGLRDQMYIANDYPTRRRRMLELYLAWLRRFDEKEK